MGPENKELMKTTSLLKEYRSEMEGMIIEVRNEEAALGDFKRRTTKDAMGLKCGGLLEMAEKLTVSVFLSEERAYNPERSEFREFEFRRSI